MFAYKYFKYKSQGLFIVEPPAGSIIYRESSASGRSMKSARTRFGGVKNCLKLIITSDALLVTPVFPFSVLGPDVDLIHSVPLKRIKSIDGNADDSKGTIRIRFELKDGTERDIDLKSKNSQVFIEALTTAVKNLSRL